MSSTPNIPQPHNEPILSYAPGTPERAALQEKLKTVWQDEIEIPVIVGGKEIRSGDTYQVVSPHDHGHTLATVHSADAATVAAAAAAAVEAQREWASWSFTDRAAVFLKAADLLAGPWRDLINASTMAGQSKTVFQAEIDAACEMIDFLKFNVHYAEQIYGMQPDAGPGVWNRLEYRPLEGFIWAISPFNFTSIGGNLCSAPALMGTTAVWKPSHTGTLSNYHMFRLFEEAGLPPGVINFVPGNPVMMTDVLFAEERIAGIHFTGSTAVFQSLWQKLAANLDRYRSYPRIVGETGGKNFIVAHPSADVAALAVAMVRAAYEYQGQKCSAGSRCYVPKSIWPELRERLEAMIGDIRMGDPADFTNFMAAVIDQKAYTKITGYIEAAKADSGVEIVAGGGASDDVGYFIEPTLLRVDDPSAVVMCEEIFGPVLTVYVYADESWSEMLSLVDTTSPYALTGAVFSQDRAALIEAKRVLRYAAGNFYVNDKPTGAVVGQQPFGGARASGTNDKAGSPLNLLRWVSPQTVKETFVPPVDYRYPHMQAE
ncbi:MAG: L-glutamate gamma-semialdehyde dehydrogenase [Gemmatimonadales bacterium]